MKLYYASGTCALAPHIVAREAGIDIELQKVDNKTKTISTPGDFLAINPKGYVPALQLDSGEILTEGPVIAQYLGDLKPASGIVPANGTMERYRLQEMLGFINSEIHKTYSPLFKPGISEDMRQDRLEYLAKRYAFIDAHLAGRQFLVGDRFSPADAYLFTVTRWARAVKLDLSQFPHVSAFQERIRARPAVQTAMQEEGLK